MGQLLIVLAGLPISGKTSLGRELERHLRIHFADIDEVKAAAFGLVSRTEYDRRMKLGEVGVALQKQDMLKAYAALHAIAEISLRDETPIIIGATYSRESYHTDLKSVADRTGARLKVILCVLRGDIREVVEARMDQRGRNSGFVLGCESWANYESDRKRYQKISGTGIVPTDHVIEVDTSQPVGSHLPEVISFIRS